MLGVEAFNFFPGVNYITKEKFCMLTKIGFGGLLVLGWTIWSWASN
jgi:hypothetical protein